MNRRAFLQSAAAAPLVFGLSDLFAPLDSAACGDLARGAQDAVSPKWWGEALKRMKDTSRYGVVLVAPEAEAERRAFAEAVYAVLESKDADVRELLFETVHICLTPALASKLAAGDGNRVLLDPDGKRVDADVVKTETFDDAKAFVESWRALVHGAKGDRLRASVARIKAGLVVKERAAVEMALDALDVESDAPAAALITLGGCADRIAPWLVMARREAVYAQGRSRVRTVLTAAAEKSGALPYGARMPKFIDVCGHWREMKADENEGTAFECGMGKAGRESRKFIKLLDE